MRHLAALIPERPAIPPPDADPTTATIVTVPISPEDCAALRRISHDAGLAVAACVLLTDMPARAAWHAEKAGASQEQQSAIYEGLAETVKSRLGSGVNPTEITGIIDVLMRAREK